MSPECETKYKEQFRIKSGDFHLLSIREPVQTRSQEINYIHARAVLISQAFNLRCFPMVYSPYIENDLWFTRCIIVS